MPPRSRAPRWRGVLRLAGMVVAFGLGGVAIWMIVFGSSQKQLRIGMIIGFWSFWFGLASLYGIRRPAPVAVAATYPPGGGEVELREQQGIETQREVAARRAYEQQLHALVRREMEHIQSSVAEQVAQLRADVAMLRGDLLEKLGGQIRLERIETTRLIGSEVEALSHEVRQLAVARGVLLPADVLDFSRHDVVADRGVAPQLLAPLAPPVRSESSTERTDVHVRFAAPPTDAIAPDIPPAPTAAPAQPAATPPPFAVPAAAAPIAADRAVAPSPAAAPAVPVAPAPAPIVQPEAVPQPLAAAAHAQSAPDPGPASSLSRDPFAGLPRLSRFAEADLGPLPTTKAGPEPVRPRGHHAADEAVGETSGGGRRRRADGETSDILTRLLSSR